MGAAVAVGFVLLALNLRAQVLDERMSDLVGTALMLSAQADSSMQALESVQDSVLEGMRASGVSTAEQYAAAVGTVEMQGMLRDRVHALRFVNAVALVDRGGKLLNVSRVWPPPEVSFADRDYYKALAGSPGQNRFVSQPVLNRVSGDWSFYIARRFDGPNGLLLGMVLGAVNLAYFQNFFGEVAPGSDASVSLYREDGQMLVRHPAADPFTGQAQRAAVVRTIMAADRRAQRIISPTDGKDRLVAVRRLAHFPIVLIVSRTVDATLVPWREQARVLAGAAMLIDLGLACLVLLATRHLRRGKRLAEAEAEHMAADERERHGRTLATYYSRFDTAVRSMSQGLCMFDSQDRLIVSNPRLAEIFDLTTSASQAETPLLAIIRDAVRRRSLLARDVRQACRQLGAPDRLRARSAFTWDLADGRAFSVSYERTSEEGWLMTFEDASERRRAEAQMAHMAYHDALTALPNRVMFHRRLLDAVAAAQRGGKQALLYVDLDGFKGVNDSLGHPIGDALLQAVTQRLLECARETDTVARLGGDEFAVIQTGLQQSSEAATLADRLIGSLSKPYQLGASQVVVGASVGIAMLPDHGLDPEELLKHADLALYQAKMEGRGRYCMFSPEMDLTSTIRRRLESNLRQAVATEMFEVHYQPLVDVDTRRVGGFEALLRWNDPGEPRVGPDTFIPVAEETGLIVPLGEWALRKACADAATWPADIGVAVNLSAVQFGSPRLVEAVADALTRAGLEPGRLELEITERVLLKNTDATLMTLHRLRGLGVRIAIDDFGTGHSSLSYLLMFPFDRVKIDRSFVRGLGTGGHCDAILGAVATMCRELGVASTAEGVESEEQFTILLRLGCSQAQGFLFSPAIPNASIPALLGLKAAAQTASGPEAVAVGCKGQSGPPAWNCITEVLTPKPITAQLAPANTALLAPDLEAVS